MSTVNELMAFLKVLNSSILSFKTEMESLGFYKPISVSIKNPLLDNELDIKKARDYFSPYDDFRFVYLESFNRLKSEETFSFFENHVDQHSESANSLFELYSDVYVDKGELDWDKTNLEIAIDPFKLKVLSDQWDFICDHGFVPIPNYTSTLLSGNKQRAFWLFQMFIEFWKKTFDKHYFDFKTSYEIGSYEEDYGYLEPLSLHHWLYDLMRRKVYYDTESTDNSCLQNELLFDYDFSNFMINGDLGKIFATFLKVGDNQDFYDDFLKKVVYVSFVEAIKAWQIYTKKLFVFLDKSYQEAKQAINDYQ